MDQDVTWYGARPRHRRLCVRWRPSPPSPKTGRSPQIFGPCLLCPNGWMHQDATCYGGRPQPRGLCVRWGPAHPFPERVRSLPNFRPMTLVPDGFMYQDGTFMEVGFGPGHIVLDGHPAPLPKKWGAEPPLFGPFLLWLNGWMDQDATSYGGRPRATRHCVRWGPSSSSPKGAQPPQYSAKVHCGQTAGWIKMPLGMEVNLGPGDVVLDGVTAPP